MESKCRDDILRMRGVNLNLSILRTREDNLGVVGCGEGVVYLTLPGRSTDTGLQLGKLAILVAGKGTWDCFYFCFFPSLSFLFLFLHCPSLSSPLLSLLSLSPFLWETTQNDHKGWRVVKPQHNQSKTPFSLGSAHVYLCTLDVF